MANKNRMPAVDGFFTYETDTPALLGTRCNTCGTYYFPKEKVLCHHPKCWGKEFDEVKLSREGKLWSFTNACYSPPPPFVAADPFVPFAIAAVELEKEKITILGQVVEGVSVDDLKVGQTMQLTVGTLYEDDENEFLTWRWQPTQEAAS